MTALPPRYRIRRPRPGDRKPLTALMLDIEGINRSSTDLRQLVASHANRVVDAEPDDLAPDLTEGQMINQDTGQQVTVHMLGGMRVVATGGRAVGFSYLFPPADWARTRRTMPTPDRSRFNERLNELNLLAVHPGHQGRGIGTALAEDAEARCRAAGYRAIMVMVYDHDGTAPATAWWARRGYTFGLPGIPWRVRPWADRETEVEYDHIDPGQTVGFKSLHPGVAVEAVRIRTASALGVRNAAMPTIAGLLDD